MKMFHVVCHVSSRGSAASLIPPLGLFSPTQIWSRPTCNQLNLGWLWRTAENQLCSVQTASCSQILAGGFSPPKIPSKSLHQHRATQADPIVPKPIHVMETRNHFPFPGSECASCKHLCWWRGSNAPSEGLLHLNISISNINILSITKLHIHHMTGWESRLGWQHRMCLLLKCPTHALGYLLWAWATAPQTQD